MLPLIVESSNLSGSTVDLSRIGEVWSFPLVLDTRARKFKSFILDCLTCSTSGEVIGLSHRLGGIVTRTRYSGLSSNGRKPV